MALQTRVEYYTGTSFDTDALQESINEAYAEVVLAAPVGMLLGVASSTGSVNSSGVSIGTSKRILMVESAKGIAQEIPADKGIYAQNSTSIYYPSDLYPVWWYREGKAYFLDASATSATAYHVDTDCPDTYSAADFTVIPTQLGNIVIHGAAVYMMMKQIDNVRSSIPNLLTDSDLPDLAYTTSVIDLTSEFSTIQTNLNNQDVELAAARIGDVKAQLAELSTEVSTEQKDVLETIQKELSKFQANVQRVISEMGNMNVQLKTLAAIYAKDLQDLREGKIE